MLTIEDSYQLFVDYARTCIPGEALSYTLDESTRTLSYIWINAKDLQIKTVFSFREDLYDSLKYHRDFTYAFSLSAYFWLNGDYHRGFTRFFVFFQLPNHDTYRILMKDDVKSWKIWFFIHKWVYKPGEGETFIELSDAEKTNEIRSLQTAAENALFEIPEFRLVALTNQLHVMRR